MNAKNMKELHKIVCSRDNYQCQGYRDGKHHKDCRIDYSGSWAFLPDGRNAYTCAHHEKTQGSHPESRFNPDVCVCVSSPCHTAIHKGL
jgi:hypothetical protein